MYARLRLNLGKTDVIAGKLLTVQCRRIESLFESLNPVHCELAQWF